ncbi:VanZ family protein [candidate division KSB1 bacterium]|nr:VanZ family protein [candidate division KSB1 bacterium]
MQNQGLIRELGRRYGWTIAWAALLFILSSIPELSPPAHVFEWDDKLHHLLAYTPLGWLLMRSLVWRGSSTRKTLWLAIALGMLYGITDEFHQHFVPGRMMDWTDAVADAGGIALGSWFFHFRRKSTPAAEKIKAEAKRKTAPL